MSKFRSVLLAGTAAAVTICTALSGVSAASPSGPDHHHRHAHQIRYVTSGHAFGTRIQIHKLGGSGRSARTALRCGATNRTRINNTAQAHLGSLGLARAVRTSSLSVPNAHGRSRTIERARVARVSLLSHFITARLIRATAIARPRKAHSTTGRSRFVGLRIGGRAFPSSAKPNTTLTIPGIARLTLNAQHRTIRHGVKSMSVDALRLTLLRGETFGPIGTTVVISHAVASRHPRQKSVLDGASSGTQLHVNGLVRSQPTFQTKLPCAAKSGKVFRHKGVGVHVPSLLRTGVVRTNARGHQSSRAGHPSSPSTAKAHATVGRVNLLHGLVRVRLLKSTSVARLAHGKITTKGSGASFLGLRINGKRMPGNAKPNTSINLLGVGTLWLNRMVPSAHGLKVHALELVLGHSYAGLAKGTVIDIANARATVRH